MNTLLNILDKLSIKEIGDLVKTFDDHPFGALTVVALALAVVKALNTIFK